MRVIHTAEVRSKFPFLRAIALRLVDYDSSQLAASAQLQHLAIARHRLAQGVESEWPSIKAWRSVYAAMGYKPTQYRCAAESLLRRFRQDGSLPLVNFLVDYCNAVSVAFGIPLAALDSQMIEGDIRVQSAEGHERYLTFQGDIEHPEPGEIIFRDDAAWAHSRRWVHRQSGRSAITANSRQVLLVAEAMHHGADQELIAMRDVLNRELGKCCGKVESLPLEIGPITL